MTMNVSVLLSSGDVDEWEDAHDAVMDMDLGGALRVFGTPEETEDGMVAKVVAMYAPGMWMKVEYDQ
jgi:hypothetical protein